MSRASCRVASGVLVLLFSVGVAVARVAPEGASSVAAEGTQAGIALGAVSFRSGTKGGDSTRRTTSIQRTDGILGEMVREDCELTPKEGAVSCAETVVHPNGTVTSRREDATVPQKENLPKKAPSTLKLISDIAEAPGSDRQAPLPDAPKRKGRMGRTRRGWRIFFDTVSSRSVDSMRKVQDFLLAISNGEE